MARYYVIILFLFSIATFSFAQCPQHKPSWANDGAIRTSNSVIRPFYATGHSLKEAQEKVETQKREERARLISQAVQSSDTKTTYSSIFDYSAGNLGEDFTLCDGEYHYWQMTQIVLNTGTNPVPERVDFTDRYPFSPRAFIPGMAQLHKGSKGKGILFIAGEIALVGGIVAFEGLRTSYESKINTTHDAASKRNYIDNADNMQNLRNGFIAGAAALYVWNVIDGIVGKGKKHVTVGMADVRFLPYATPDAGGISLAINF